MAKRWEWLNVGTLKQISFLRQKRETWKFKWCFMCNKIREVYYLCDVYHNTDQSRIRSDSPWSSLPVALSRWGSVSPAVPEGPLGKRRGGWKTKQTVMLSHVSLINEGITLIVCLSVLHQMLDPLQTWQTHCCRGTEKVHWQKNPGNGEYCNDI